MTDYQIHYFGMIAECTTCEQETITAEKILTVHQLEDILQQKYPKLNSLSYKIAVDQSFVSEEITIQKHQEIALLPPFAGG